MIGPEIDGGITGNDKLLVLSAQRIESKSPSTGGADYFLFCRMMHQHYMVVRQRRMRRPFINRLECFPVKPVQPLMRRDPYITRRILFDPRDIVIGQTVNTRIPDIITFIKTLRPTIPSRQLQKQ